MMLKKSIKRLVSGCKLPVKNGMYPGSLAITLIICGITAGFLTGSINGAIIAVFGMSIYVGIPYLIGAWYRGR